MKVTLTRWLSLCSYLGLIAFGMAWAISLGEFKPNQVSFMLVVMVLPLLFPLRGILHGRDKAIVWGTLISLLYIVHGGMGWWSESHLWVWGMLETLLAVTYLFTASFFIRWRADNRQNND